MSETTENIANYRSFAERLRTVANIERAPKDRRLFREIAADYDRMADTLEAIGKNKLRNFRVVTS